MVESGELKVRRPSGVGEVNGASRRLETGGRSRRGKIEGVREGRNAPQDNEEENNNNNKKKNRRVD